MIRLGRKSGIFLLGMGVILWLGACNTRTVGETVGDVLVPVPENDSSLVVDNQSEPDTSLLIANTTPEPMPVNECLACHLDKQRLIDAAAPEAIVESESSGEG